MTLIAARRSLDRSYLYLEGEDYIVLKARSETAAIFAKRAPFVTGSYCDDLAVAASLVPAGAHLLVLGGSFGSTCPLCFECNSGISIVSVDRDAEVTRAGQHFNTNVLGVERARTISWLVQPAHEISDEVLRDAGAIFIDLYDAGELSPLVYDATLHARIASHARPDAVVFFNIFDVLYETESACPTRFVLARLARFYTSFLSWRRRRASILVCAREPADRLEDRVRAALDRAVRAGVARPENLQQAVPASAASGAWDSTRFGVTAQLDLGPIDRGGADDSMIMRSERDAADLKPFDIVALLKARSSFLDF